MAEIKDDDIIELTEMLDGNGSEDQDLIELTEVAEAEPLALELSDAPTADDASKSPAAPADRAAADPGGLEGITREQLDAALERVIEKKFAQRIETILFEVTEKVIKKEIAEIKAGLQKDLDDIDNA